MKKLLAAAAVLGLLIAVPGVSATEGTPHKVYVCKYVGTPHVDERLKDGKNPIDVDYASIKDAPADIWDSIGFAFADAQDHSIVIAVDDGQDAPGIEDCPQSEQPSNPPSQEPPSNPPSNPPSEEPPSNPPSNPPSQEPPSNPPSNPPSEEPPSNPPSNPPSSPPEIGTFSVATCPVTGLPVPVGQSAISIKGSILLILLLHVRVDGVPVTLQDVIGNGTVGEVFVTPGSHTVTISNAADDAVLFETTVNCPDCSGGVLGETAPPTDVAGTTGGNVSGGGMLFILIGLAGLILTTAFVAPTRASRRKRP